MNKIIDELLAPTSGENWLQAIIRAQRPGVRLDSFWDDTPYDSAASNKAVAEAAEKIMAEARARLAGWPK